jgi:hypothetical protein
LMLSHLLASAHRPFLLLVVGPCLHLFLIDEQVVSHIFQCSDVQLIINEPTTARYFMN